MLQTTPPSPRRGVRATLCLLPLLIALAGCQDKPTEPQPNTGATPDTSTPSAPADASAATPPPPADASAAAPTPPADASAAAPPSDPPSDPTEAFLAQLSGPAPPGFQASSERQLELLKGALEQAEKNDSEATLLFLLTLKDTPEKSPALMFGLQLLGEVYLKTGEPEKGLKVLEAGARDFPTTPEFEISLAELNMAVGNNDKAIAHLRKSLDLDGTALPYHIALINLLHDTGDVAGRDAAITAYDQALAQVLPLLQSQETPPQVLHQLITQHLSGFRDPRLAETLVRLVAYPNPQVSEAALEVIVTSGYRESVPAFERLRDAQADPKAKDALNQLIQGIQGIEDARVEAVPHLPVVPEPSP